MTYEINVINVGRAKVSKTFNLNARKLVIAEDAALRECKKHLLSDGVSLGAGDNGEYTVYAGFSDVGRVVIRPLK